MNSTRQANPENANKPSSNLGTSSRKLWCGSLTKIKPFEREVLKRIYLCLVSDERHGMSTDELETFLCFTLGISDEFALSRLTYLFSHKNHKQVIHVDKFISLMYVLIRGSDEEIADLAFKIFDIDGNVFMCFAKLCIKKVTCATSLACQIAVM